MKKSPIPVEQQNLTNLSVQNRHKQLWLMLSICFHPHDGKINWNCVLQHGILLTNRTNNLFNMNTNMRYFSRSLNIWSWHFFWFVNAAMFGWAWWWPTLSAILKPLSAKTTVIHSEKSNWVNVISSTRRATRWDNHIQRRFPKTKTPRSACG